MSSAVTAPPAWVNEPRRPGPVAVTREVWAHRRFLKFLGVRAMQKLYRRTVLGWLWLLILPLFPILIRVVVFGGVVGVTAQGIPYFLFVTVGSLSWNLFSSGMSWSTRGLEMNRKVLSRVYVPKLILPLATITPAVFSFVVSFGVLVVAALYYWWADGTPYVTFGLHTLWTVASFVVTLVLVLGAGMFMSVWGETARDVRLTLSQVLGIWFLVTPVLYSVTDVPPAYRRWLFLNPMAALVEAFEAGLLNTPPPDLSRFILATVLSFAIAVGGLAYFARHDDLEEEGGNG